MTIRFFFLLFVLLFLLGCSFTHKYAHPSDAELADTLNKQKEDFNHLTIMFAEDLKGKNPTAFWIGRDNKYSWTLEEFSDERKRKYLELMSKLNIKTVGMVYEEPEIIILTVTIDSKDIENGEHEVDVKGYAYSPQKTPSRVVYFGETDLRGSCYKKILENWYIFHSTRSGHGE